MGRVTNRAGGHEIAAAPDQATTQARPASTSDAGPAAHPTSRKPGGHTGGGGHGQGGGSGGSK